jgi:hypothetical protein
MLTPPPSNSSKYALQERKIQLFTKANSKSKNENKFSPTPKKPPSSSSLSSRSFHKNLGKQVECKLILAPQALEKKPEVPKSLESLNKRDVSKSSDRLVASNAKKSRIKKQVENYAGFQELLNELLIDKKYKCFKCFKCICECLEKNNEFQGKRAKIRFKGEIKKNYQQKVVNSGIFQNESKKKVEESEFFVLNRRRISFSLLNDQSFITIHSNKQKLKKMPIKKRCHTARRDRKNESEVDLLISVSPVCFSNRPK